MFIPKRNTNIEKARVGGKKNKRKEIAQVRFCFSPADTQGRVALLLIEYYSSYHDSMSSCDPALATWKCTR